MVLPIVIAPLSMSALNITMIMWLSALRVWYVPSFISDPLGRQLKGVQERTDRISLEMFSCTGRSLWVGLRVMGHIETFFQSMQCRCVANAHGVPYIVFVIFVTEDLVLDPARCIVGSVTWSWPPWRIHPSCRDSFRVNYGIDRVPFVYLVVSII